MSITKLIAITGARGTGVSTVTAAMAEHMARGPTSVCIVDLSISCGLEKSLSLRKDKFDSNSIIKINSNLCYMSLSPPLDKIPSDSLVLNKILSRLQDDFSYIFIDVDITLIKYIEQYLNHIFIVSDMNPFNAADISKRLEIDDMLAKCVSRTSFIINKFYKGELSSQNILQGLLLTVEGSQKLKEMMAYSKIFEFPYDSKVYIKWVYSFFGDPLRFIAIDSFKQIISNILSSTILPKTKKAARFSLINMLNRIGGNNQWAKD